MSKSTIEYIFISLRPWQWIKNLTVFAAIIFSRELFISVKFLPVFYTFLIFNAASSTSYLINDIVDQPRDKIHFSKKRRPIAAGKLKPNTGLLFAFLLAVSSLVGAFFLSNILFLIVLFYLLLQISYTLILKEIIILDILTIAVAFMLRVFAGSLVVLTPLSSWLILTTMMLSLFLAIGKRRSELTLLSAQQRGGHRKTLSFYPLTLLDGWAFMMATATLITYSLFTFNSPESHTFFTSFLPETLASPKLLMATIPIVAYGIFRYLYLIFEKKEGASPEKIILNDRPLFFSALVWSLVIFIFLYSSPL